MSTDCPTACACAGVASCANSRCASPSETAAAPVARRNSRRVSALITGPLLSTPLADALCPFHLDRRPPRPMAGRVREHPVVNVPIAAGDVLRLPRRRHRLLALDPVLELMVLPGVVDDDLTRLQLSRWLDADVEGADVVEHSHHVVVLQTTALGIVDVHVHDRLAALQAQQMPL